MIESPLIKELIAETNQEVILEVLAARFGTIPPEIGAGLKAIDEVDRLHGLARWAAQCPDLAAFQAKLAS
jgi:hypothetical protein